MRPTTEQRDTLAAEIVMEAGVHTWSSAASLERATLVLNHCADVGIEASVVTPLELSAAMNCMPLNAQSIHNYGDMVCALAAVLPKAQSVNAELLAAATKLLARLEEERQIFVDSSSVNGVVDDEDDKEVLAKFDAAIQPARAAIARAQS